MCGPLAYVLLSPEKGKEDCEVKSLSQFNGLQMIYHSARVISFTIFGIIAGFLGLSVINILKFPLFKVFPWILIAFFVIFGLGWDKLIPKIPYAKKIFGKLAEKIVGINKPFAAAILGLMTPFLPCGPLYMILWVALSSGSPLFGAEIAFAFAIGTVPLMFLIGSQYNKRRYQFSPRLVFNTQRIIAFACAAILLWRVLKGNGSPLNEDFCCF